MRILSPGAKSTERSTAWMPAVAFSMKASWSWPAFTNAATSEAAVRSAKELGASNVPQAGIYLELAQKELNQGKAASALARFAAQPESPDALKGQALALQRLGRHADAVRALERAHVLAPDDARIELLLAAERSRADETK